MLEFAGGQTAYNCLIDAINDTSIQSKDVVQITVQLSNDFCKTLTYLRMPTITDMIPGEIFPRYYQSTLEHQTCKSGISSIC